MRKFIFVYTKIPLRIYGSFRPYIRRSHPLDYQKIRGCKGSILPLYPLVLNEPKPKHLLEAGLGVL